KSLRTAVDDHLSGSRRRNHRSQNRRRTILQRADAASYRVDIAEDVSARADLGQPLDLVRMEQGRGGAPTHDSNLDPRGSELVQQTVQQTGQVGQSGNTRWTEVFDVTGIKGDALEREVRKLHNRTGKRNSLIRSHSNSPKPGIDLRED